MVLFRPPRAGPAETDRRRWGAETFSESGRMRVGDRVAARTMAKGPSPGSMCRSPLPSRGEDGRDARGLLAGCYDVLDQATDRWRGDSPAPIALPGGADRAGGSGT